MVPDPFQTVQALTKKTFSFILDACTFWYLVLKEGSFWQISKSCQFQRAKGTVRIRLPRSIFWHLFLYLSYFSNIVTDLITKYDLGTFVAIKIAIFSNLWNLEKCQNPNLRYQMMNIVDYKQNHQIWQPKHYSFENCCQN